MNLGKISSPSPEGGSIAVMLILILTFTVAVSAADTEQMNVYIPLEADRLSVAKLVTYLLRTRLDVNVHEKVQYHNVGLKKVADGEGDLFVGLELPTNRDTPQQYSLYQFCDLGPIYEDIRYGWGVPNYIPQEKLGSIMDLTEEDVKARLHREIIGSKEDSHLVDRSEQVMKNIKNLDDYKIVLLQDIVANSELERSIRSKEWIVFFLKRPSVRFVSHDTRFLAELTNERSLHMLARTDFMAKYPDEVTQFLSRFYLSIDLTNELLKLFDENKGTAAHIFTERHPKLVDYWLKGMETFND